MPSMFHSRSNSETRSQTPSSVADQHAELYHSAGHLIGARKGATGTLADLKNARPAPKAWVQPVLIETVMQRLAENQSGHSRLPLQTILHHHLFDSAKNRYRITWSKHMITAAGVSSIRAKGKEELLLHFRDGEEENKGNKRWMRQVLESLFKKGGRVREAVEDFFYLTLVHEASEIHQRKRADTLSPEIKAEVRAEIEEAKAYFSLPPERRKILLQLYQLLDESSDPRLKVYSRELELFDSIGAESLGTIPGIIKMIEFVISTPDYAREANLYPDERTRLQLARSLFVDILHDFGGASRVDRWVREVESAAAFSDSALKFEYSEHAASLSGAAEEILQSAARILGTLKVSDAEEPSIPGTKQKKRVIDNFNRKIAQLDDIKQQLKINEVLSIPSELRDVLEDNALNRHFSYMDQFGIYHSLNLSRLDLRGLDLHSGQDERSTNDRNRDVNQHKDERSDLRGAHIVGSDLSGRANFSAAQLDFVLAAFSNLCEINFTRTRAIGMVFYGANGDEGQFEHARMTAVDARGMSANFARIQMKETDINGMKIWQSDVPSWQRAYVDISRSKTVEKEVPKQCADRDSIKAELDFLDDSFLDELDSIDEGESLQSEEKWIELREVDGQLEFLKGRGIVFFSREETLEYTASFGTVTDEDAKQEKIA